ncbi:Suppressor of fused protein (SUFU) [Pseudomonas tructae]|uniref:Suppressor of fused protein (SUFU) n=1 Tax=Pseudomonas tructae TaxID=2518644 RepID=A0A411ML81_9PSED|nr:suppressor of fused domain protein [Pseudomonas tructae]QBF27528.1 Suppressor of fused protein (SUFU) [Pseudomonas tructae]
MNIFKTLLDSLKKPAPPQDPAITPAEADNQAARQAGEACLDRHWSSVGTVENDVLAYLISPSFSGGPHWPSTRQAYRVVRRGDSIILATEGLSDPFDDDEGQGNGFEMELFVETADIPEHARGPLGEVDPFKRSWAFELIENVAKTVADAGGITPQLERYGALSLELPGFSESHHISSQVPAQFVTEDDCIGVLLGGLVPDFPIRLDGMPLSPVTLVPVVLITAAELEYIRAGGGAARSDLVSRLQAAGVGHVSSLQRASVV